MFEVDISIEEMLNGRYQCTKKNCEVVKAIFEELPTDVIREVKNAADDELAERRG